MQLCNLQRLIGQIDTGYLRAALRHALSQYATAATDIETNWAQVVKLYGQLYELEPTPIVALNRAVALSQWQGPEAAILSLEGLAKNRALRSYHLLPAVLGELWRQMGDFGRAAKAYRKALKCNCTVPERHFLESQLRTVDGRA